MTTPIVDDDGFHELDDDEFDAQVEAQIALFETAEFWEDEEQSYAALNTERRRLRDYLLSADDLDKIPPVRWLIDGLLPEDAIALLYAEPGAGKSFIALDWAAHLATGKEAWQGRALRPDTRVLYIYAEGAPGLRKRRDAWCTYHHGGAKIGTNLMFLVRAANFLSLAHWDPSVEAEDDWTELLGIVAELRPHLIIVDTMSRAIPGKDENDQATMSLLVDRIDHLRETSHGATVLLIHHANAGGTRERGSTVIPGAINTRIWLNQENILKVTKQKDDQEPVLGRVELTPVEGTDSVVPIYIEVVDDGPDNETIRRRQILEYVAQNPGTSPTGMHEAIGGGKEILLKALSKLEHEGHVQVAKVGNRKAIYPSTPEASEETQ